jgi:4-alpha-glucanotransferase
MRLQRSAGVLLHPTSFPGPDGIGDVGPQAYRWVDWLAATGCTWWQLLPLGPTGYGDSPYQCFSAFAGNPLLISAELLLQDGLLTGDDLKDRPEFPADRVDFGPVIQWKLQLLDRAYERYLADSAPLRAQFESFQAREYYWLSDFALFMSIKEAQGGVSWEHWPKPLRMRAPQALKEARQSEAVQRHAFRQFLFFKQWNALREYAHAQGLRLIGDIPIFVAFDSADAWSHSELFYLDEERQPTIVAGVPPDYFSPTGQLWGNPLYRWEAHAQSGYAWWIDRMRATLQQVDIIRLDHFRGFAGYWAVPYGNPTAEIGEWRPGPGKPFLTALQQALGDLPIIAEDLAITPDGDRSCATVSICPACAFFSLVWQPQDPSCRITTSQLRGTRARTTTIPCWAGIRLRQEQAGSGAEVFEHHSAQTAVGNDPVAVDVGGETGRCAAAGFAGLDTEAR